jgi:hypothetical protein
VPDVREVFPSLEAMNGAELEQRRRLIVEKLRGVPLDEAPIDALKELSAITAQLRIKSAGPPKSAEAKKGAKKVPVKKATLDDIAGLL